MKCGQICVCVCVCVKLFTECRVYPLILSKSTNLYIMSSFFYGYYTSLIIIYANNNNNDNLHINCITDPVIFCVTLIK